MFNGYEYRKLILKSDLLRNRQMEIGDCLTGNCYFIMRCKWNTLVVPCLVIYLAATDSMRFVLFVKMLLPWDCNNHTLSVVYKTSSFEHENSVWHDTHQNKSTHEHVYCTTKDQKTKKVNIVLFLRRISFVLRKGDLSWLTLITCKWFEWSHVSFLFGYKREHVILLDDPRKSHASYVCPRLQGMSPLLRSTY